MKRRAKLRIKRNLRRTLMSVIIVSAAVISALAITMVSQQEKVRELRLAGQYKDRVAAIRDQLEQKTQSVLKRTFAQVNESGFSRSSPDTLLGQIKKIVLDNPIVQYPFVLELTQKTFRFPFSRKTPGSGIAIADKALTDPVVSSVYRKGRRLEVENRRYSNAITLYQKAFHTAASPNSRLYISNAMARCYFKSNRFRQALWYYHQNLRTFQTLFNTEQELYFLTLRQTALSYKLMRLDNYALKYYLQLYETIISSPKISNPGISELFKNEALDYLNQYPIQNEEASERFNRAKASDRLKQATNIDIALSWMFFELESPSSNDYSEDSDSRKLRELYTTTDEKARYYQTVKRSPHWTSQPLQKTSAAKIADKGTGETFHVVSRKLSQNLVFGFQPSSNYVRRQLFQDIAAGSIEDPRLRVRISRNNAAPNTQDAFQFKLITLPVSDLFPQYNILLLSNRPDFFGRLAKKEIRSSYILIALLIIVMTVGTGIFYKYIAREEELLRLKAEFVDSVSHTLKTPLTRMGLLAENIRRGWIKDEAKKEQFLETIMAETSRMNDMVNNMLNFSRIDSGKKQYEFSEARIQDIVTSTLAQYRGHIEAAGFTCRQDIDPALPPLQLDPEAVKLVLVNLLQNAIKYSDKEKFIEVRLYREERYAVLAVEDHGMGIDKRDRQRIFDKFYRACDTHVKAREGSGLGLFLVHHAVAAHNGKVEVSIEPGKGSTFLVYLPIDKR